MTCWNNLMQDSCFLTFIIKLFTNEWVAMDSDIVTLRQVKSYEAWHEGLFYIITLPRLERHRYSFPPVMSVTNLDVGLSSLCYPFISLNCLPKMECVPSLPHPTPPPNRERSHLTRGNWKLNMYMYIYIL